MTLGERIATLRKEKNLSQEYIADSLGISRQAVSKWEQDISAPDTRHLIDLSKLFEVSVEYLTCGKEETPLDAVAVPSMAFPVFKILGIIFIAVGAFAFVLGFATMWLISTMGALLAIFGILFVTLKRQGMFLSLAIFLLCVTLTLAAAFSSGLDIPIVLMIAGCSVVVPLLVFAIVKAVRLYIRRPRSN